MKGLMQRKRLLMLVCFVATLGLAACGDDGGNNGGSNNGGGNNGADAGNQDTGDQDAGDQDGGDQDGGDQDGGDQDGGDTSTPPDNLTGFTAPADLVLDESAGAWALYGETDDQLISLVMYKEGGLTDVGSVDFQDVPYADMNNELILADGCTQDGCAGFFLATSGTLEVTTWEQDTEGGAFEATLTDVELVEVTPDEFGNFTPVADGRTWTIDSTSLTATVDPVDTFPETVTCDNTGFTADGEVTAVEDQGVLLVNAASAATAPTDNLSLQIYPGEDFGGADAPGEYQLDDFNYATCGNCLLLSTGCQEDGTCDKTFIAGAGTLDITSIGTIGEQFTATLTDAKLVEVTIDQNYESTLVEGGEGWCIDSFSWDLPVTAPPSE